MRRALFWVLGALVSLPALAGGGGGVDYSALLDAIDFGDIATGVVGAGAALVAVYLAIKGVKIIIGFLGGGGAGFTNPNVMSTSEVRAWEEREGLVWSDEKEDWVER